MKVEEFLKSIYLRMLVFQKRKINLGNVGYILSFSDNDGGLIQYLIDHYQERFYLFYTKQMSSEVTKYNLQKSNCILYDTRTLLLGAFGKLSTMDNIIIDNYFPEIACLEQNKIIQIWHATGAIKKFGWEDRANEKRSKLAQTRFQSVYNQMSFVIVGSEAMKEVFLKSYRLPEEKVKVLGSPRSMYFQPIDRNQEKEYDYLYLPTYRESINSLLIVLNKMNEVAYENKDKQFYYHLHPSILSKIDAMLSFPANVKVSTPEDSDSLSTLFSISRSVVTDYSSAAIDFHQMNPESPVFFFCPDIKDYRIIPGVQPLFENLVGNRIITTPKELSKLLNEKHIGEQEKEFLSCWNANHNYDVLKEIKEIIER